LLLYLKKEEQAGLAQIMPMSELGARFMRAVSPGRDVELVARVFEAGLFFVSVGQCLPNESTCSVAAIRCTA
jgi:hypothetical protein